MRSHAVKYAVAVVMSRKWQCDRMPLVRTADQMVTIPMPLGDREGR